MAVLVIVATESPATFNESLRNWLGSMFSVDPSILTDEYIANVIRQLTSNFTSQLLLARQILTLR